jgi:S-adenosylmethionine decarboxylase
MHQENQAYEAFGPHLILGGYGADGAAVADPERVRQFLVSIPGQIGMTPISPVVVMPTDRGISGFLIIAESHIVVHTKIKGAEVHLDIFSCKDFDTGHATLLFCEAFGPFKNTEFQLLDRGLEFPRNVAWVEKHVREESLRLPEL